MPKRVSLYIFFGAVAVAAFVLGMLVTALVFKGKPAARPTAPAVSEAPAPAAPAAKPQVPAAPAVKKEAAPVTPAVVLPPRVTKPEFQKGMVLVAWTPNGYANENLVRSLEQLSAMGVDWVGIVTTWYQDRPNSTDIYADKNKTPSDESLIFAIRKLHEMKFKVMLKPHLDLVDAQGKWRGDIGFENDADWQTWFESYSAFIMRYAAISAQEGVELICIGTELGQATVTQPERWRELIKQVRQVYPGQLTYAANWSNEYDLITFWDALDYAGIDPYFPLVCTLNPKVDELKSAWLDWIKPIEEWQKKINKPVLFTEVGYKSSKDATDEPWQHVAVGEVDLEVQANCYQAALESFWDKPWFYGMYWWFWGVSPRMGGTLNRGFTPQNKPSADIVKEWYKKPVAAKAY